MLPRDISPASFRGVRFLVPNDTAEFGRNAVRHAYPDANFHYLEDNGLNPPEFKITAILAGPGLPGKWRALQSALARPGPGLLKHPYWGNQFVMVDGKARVRRDDRDAGTLEIEIPFSVTGPPSLPGPVSGVAAYVTGLATSTLTRLFDEFADTYADPTSPTSALAVAESLSTIGDAIKAAFGSAGTEGADLSYRATELVLDVGALSTLLAEAIETPRQAEDVYSNAEAVAGFATICDVAADTISDADLIPQDTFDRVRRRDCITTIGITVEAAAFLGMAEAMAARHYETADEIDIDEEILTDRLDRLQERDLSGQMHADLVSVFTATSQILSDQALRRPRVIALTTLPVPVSVLAYELYESDANVEHLDALNLDQPPILMAETVNVLMET